MSKSNQTLFLLSFIEDNMGDVTYYNPAHGDIYYMIMKKRRNIYHCGQCSYSYGLLDIPEQQHHKNPGGSKGFKTYQESLDWCIEHWIENRNE